MFVSSLYLTFLYCFSSPPNVLKNLSPVQTDPKPTRQYKGVHFGKMTSQRTDFGGKGGPGPGDYDPYKEVLNKAENANVHDEEVAAVRHESRVPRYHEAIAKEIEKRVSGDLLYYYPRLTILCLYYSSFTQLCTSV